MTSRPEAIRQWLAQQPAWRRVSSAGASRVERLRKSLAEALIDAAYKVDPLRPTVTRGENGSHIISVSGVRLARIDPGMIRDMH